MEFGNRIVFLGKVYHSDKHHAILTSPQYLTLLENSDFETLIHYPFEQSFEYLTHKEYSEARDTFLNFIIQQSENTLIWFLESIQTYEQNVMFENFQTDKQTIFNEMKPLIIKSLANLNLKKRLEALSMDKVVYKPNKI